MQSSASRNIYNRQRKVADGSRIWRDVPQAGNQQGADHTGDNAMDESLGAEMVGTFGTKNWQQNKYMRAFGAASPRWARAHPPSAVFEPHATLLLRC